MRRTIIAGNWKMNKTIAEALAFADGLRQAFPEPPGREVILAPPFTALRAVADRLAGSFVRLAAQNLHEAQKGAYTGEVSGPMLKEAGCTYGLVGHSERRTLFGEGDGLVNRKVAAALEAGLRPIFCLGESLQEREGGRTFSVVERQLKEGLNNLSASDIGLCVLAYEPVWAIGTGRTASPGQAQEVHRFIREWIRVAYGGPAAEALRLLYGGSVTPDNAPQLLAQPDIDGALVGGASLDAEAFVRIIKG
jgi:triosephosphate isomerase